MHAAPPAWDLERAVTTGAGALAPSRPPVANAVALVITALVGRHLGEPHDARRLLLGCLLVSLGVFLCLRSRADAATAAAVAAAAGAETRSP